MPPGFSQTPSILEVGDKLRVLLKKEKKQEEKTTLGQLFLNMNAEQARLHTVGKAQATPCRPRKAQALQSSSHPSVKPMAPQTPSIFEVGQSSVEEASLEHERKAGKTVHCWQGPGKASQLTDPHCWGWLRGGTALQVAF